MKRIKIMLLAVTLVAGVGGALAFKAKNVDLYCGSSTSSCATFETKYKTTIESAAHYENTFCSTQQNINCTFVTLQ